MKKTARTLAAVAGALLVVGTGARAASTVQSNAEFQNYLAAHHYVQIPLDSGGMNEQEVVVTIAGRKLQMIVDTGCSRTCITYDAARHLHLKVTDTGKRPKGVGGELKETEGLAIIPNFNVGGFEINRLNSVGVLPRSAECSTDGLLGLDFLRLNGAILLVGSQGMILKPGNTPVVPLAPYMSTLGFTPVPLHFSNGEIRLDGRLNGTPFKAVVDTGDSFSAFDEKLVRAATDRYLSTIPVQMRGIDGEKIESFSFIPKTLELGNFEVPPLQLTASTSPTVSQEGIAALVGYDLMARQLAVIDLGGSVIWMK